MHESLQSPGETLASISNGLVKLHTRYYGKGPTKAKSYLIDDTVICLLEEGFTTVERTLIEDGRSGAVHDIRRTFQAAMQEQFTQVVEEAMGRKVIAYLSQVHVDPDLAAELFVLESSSDREERERAEVTAEDPTATVSVMDLSD